MFTKFRKIEGTQFKMATMTLRLCYLLIMFTSVIAAPKPFACMSYLEDDRSLLQDDEDFDEYTSAQLNESTAPPMPHLAADSVVTAQRRICPADYTFCFSLWRQTNNGTHIEKQGCWKESTERNATCSHSECSSSAPTSRNNSLYYCCCSGDACNAHVSVVEPAPLQLSKASMAANFDGAPDADTVWGIVLMWCSLLAASVLISTFASYFYCRGVAREKPVPESAPLAPSGPGYSSNLRNVDNMNLVGMLGAGKYGTVMKGLLHDQEVAVKIFPETHHQYYINERNIYSLPLMDCPALLAYYGYDERHTMEGRIEYQLVLSLAPLGCLQDWLIANAPDFEIFCGMAKSITRGLSHLHTELRRGDAHKPCIAHRDLNSRNVLVNADRSCAIADFGFALKVFGAKYEYKGEIAAAETKSINEVGTLRYMAPELLEGAVNLRDCETSLKQMDVYALGLVLWEVSARCSDFYAPAQLTPPYKAPYELEVGAHPSFDQMQALVVRHKARPLFPAGWGGGGAAKLVRDTCEDCWDHDAEARLTSLCAEERMQEVAGLRPRLQPHPGSAGAASPLLSAANNLEQHVRTTKASDCNINTAEVAPSNLELATTLLQPPPNQQVPHLTNDFYNTGAPQEKNHLIQPQQQLQPYQGRNPCQARNLAPPASARPSQVLVAKSKKHSFQSAAGQENSFSCLEDDVSVEELISAGVIGGVGGVGCTSKKFVSIQSPVDAAANMGQGFPKQHNTDRKLRGWHGVRALIQKKLFRRDGGVSSSHGGDVFRQAPTTAYGDEKSNLVADNRYSAAAATVVKSLDNNCAPTPPPLLAKMSTVSFIDSEKPTRTTTTTTSLEGAGSGGSGNYRRPNNLDLSPVAAHASSAVLPTSNLIHSIAEEECNGNVKQPPQLQRLDQRISTPCHVVPRSFSASLIKNHTHNITSSSNNNNNNQCEAKTKLNEIKDETTAEPQFRRQRSLEVFREVFGGRGSTDKLRDPSQRVKTPGDVPPSVRRIRASKTLSLYDDRMMDSSTLNIL